MIDLLHEIEFWTLILRDHAEFQLTSLSSSELEPIRNAEYFINVFENLHNQVVTIKKTNENQLIELVSKNKNAVSEFIKFKKGMLDKLLTSNIKLSMPPSFLNHMINEALEFYRILAIYEQNRMPNNYIEQLRLHKIWLVDASGHAKFIADNLDGIESIIINKAQEYITIFDKLFKKSYELFFMFDRTKKGEAIVEQLNAEVEANMIKFIAYLDSLQLLKQEGKISSNGLFLPLVLNHMIREEKYYICQIKNYSNSKNNQ